MSATDLERRLADALRQHADEVIAEADTQARHGDLMRELRQLRRSSRDHEVLRVQPSRSPRRSWVVGLAAAAAVALVVGLSTLLPQQADDPQVVAPAADASALRVARDFVDAFASFDVERAESLLAEDAETHIWSTRTGEDVWRQGFRWLEAVGAKTILHSCRLTGTSALGTLVECAFDWHTLYSEKLGYGPYVGGLFMFTVDDGKVVWVRQSSMSDQFGVEMWQPFAKWVKATHPENAPQMYADWPNQGYESLTPHSIELWRELSREWVRAQRR